MQAHAVDPVDTALQLHIVNVDAPLGNLTQRGLEVDELLEAQAEVAATVTAEQARVERAFNRARPPVDDISPRLPGPGRRHDR